VRNLGGLWDESFELYSKLDGHPREATLEWSFPSGASVKFSHLENEKSVFDWQGSQIPYIGFDELVHFTERQFWYMLSRNRSMSGVPGYVRATCNPDADSWVRRLISWWIGDDGYAIKERSGVIRWFIRQGDELTWADSREELIQKFGAEQQPKSLTFIAANIYDNKILMDKDPAYLSNLMALSRVERLRLLGGNWNVRPAAGMYFQRGWFEVIEAHNADAVRSVRYWDRAATKPNEENRDPDWTVGLLLHKLNTGVWVVGNIARVRDTPLNVERFIKNVATQDGYKVEIYVEQDPGSAGVADVDNYIRMLSGYRVHARKVTKDKITRALPVSAQCEANNVKLIRAEWNEPFLNETENFPDGAHDDQVDAFSGAFNEMAQHQPGILGVMMQGRR
jgi:predicted phage terminase large subunit-like protein